MKKVTRKFTVLFTPDDDDKLNAICAAKQISKGEALRRCIRSMYAMEILSHPTCANGMRCLVPHYHHQQMPLPEPEQVTQRLPYGGPRP